MENQKLHELIANWLDKPTFKLEDEPGYEEHRDKLLLYRIQLQENTKIRALQQKILNEVKEQWLRLPGKSPADDPELNLFRKELQAFYKQVLSEKDISKHIQMVEDIRLAFLEVTAMYPLRLKDEKMRLLRMYKHIDFSIVPLDTPGLDELKNEISEWIEKQDSELLSSS